MPRLLPARMIAPGFHTARLRARFVTVPLSHSSSLTRPVSPACAYRLPVGHWPSAVPRLDMPYCVDLAVASAIPARIRLPGFPVSRAKDSKNASLPPE